MYKLKGLKHFTIGTARYHTGTVLYYNMEDGGRLGAHAQALLRSFATLAVEKGRRPLRAYRDSSSSSPTLASLWVQRWQQRLSTWMHLALSKQVLRILCPDAASRQSFI